MWIIGIIIVIWIIWAIIAGIIERHRQGIRDKVANELFNNSGIETIIGKNKKKLNGIIIIQKQEAPKRIPNWEWSKLPKYARKIVNSACPLCGVGYLEVDYFYNGFGRVASSFSCSLKPKCNYKISLKRAKAKFEQENTKAFKKDFNQVYS